MSKIGLLSKATKVLKGFVFFFKYTLEKDNRTWQS